MILRQVNELIFVVYFAQDDVRLIKNLIKFVLKAHFICSLFEYQEPIADIVAIESVLLDEKVVYLGGRKALSWKPLIVSKVNDEEVRGVR